MRNVFNQYRKRVRRICIGFLKSITKLSVPQKVALFIIVLVGFGSILFGVRDPKPIYTASLLDTIAKVESNDNYNAYYGNARNTEIQFTSMSVKEVLDWQKNFINSGSPSSAVGRYQFINTTLQSLVAQLQIEENAIFDEALQDSLAAELLDKRGLRAYMNNEISRDQFAHNLSKEWAALPKIIGDNPDQSYYQGDGLNSARLSVAELYSSIATLREI